MPIVLQALKRVLLPVVLLLVHLGHVGPGPVDDQGGEEEDDGLRGHPEAQEDRLPPAVQPDAQDQRHDDGHTDDHRGAPDHAEEPGDTVEEAGPVTGQLPVDAVLGGERPVVLQHLGDQQTEPDHEDEQEHDGEEHPL
ncbi:hypothetical protein AB0M20_43050, partial [Actinoplanes sp. NPDC051633]|uniref:hypothetical protein n=1 Tax=Actinoplanes sp. NPDC051633 TaxID=3155670 RepID=UPI00341C18B5